MTLAISTYAPDPTQSIAASALGVYASSVDPRQQLSHGTAIATEAGIPIGTEIWITPTLTPSSYYIDSYTT